MDLPPLTKPILPALPRRAKHTGGWSTRTRSAWKAWRSDPVTTQYGPAEIQAAVDLAFLYEEMVRGKLSLLAEIRQMQDRLGLNPKGKRDLRWRVPESPEVKAEGRQAKKSSSSSRRARLTVVK